MVMESGRKVLEGKEKMITVDTEALKSIKPYGEALKSDREALKGNGEIKGFFQNISVFLLLLFLISRGDRGTMDIGAP